jgi:hypothetical protein
MTLTLMYQKRWDGHGLRGRAAIYLSILIITIQYNIKGPEGPEWLTWKGLQHLGASHCTIWNLVLL